MPRAKSDKPVEIKASLPLTSATKAALDALDTALDLYRNRDTSLDPYRNRDRQGEPSSTGNRNRTLISVAVSSDTLRKIDSLCEERGLSRGKVIDWVVTESGESKYK